MTTMPHLDPEAPDQEARAIDLAQVRNRHLLSDALRALADRIDVDDELANDATDAFRDFVHTRILGRQDWAEEDGRLAHLVWGCAMDVSHEIEDDEE